MLDKPVESLSGIGRVSGAALRERGLATVADMLFVLPRQYLDEREVTALRDLEPGMHQVTVGVIEHARRMYFKRRAVTEVVLGALPEDSAEPKRRLYLRWYYTYPNQLDKLVPGTRLRVSARVSRSRGMLMMAHPSVHVLSDNDVIVRALKPRYPEVPGLSVNAWTKAISHAVRDAVSEVTSAVPSVMAEAEGLMPLADAIRALHLPSNTLSLKELEELNACCSPYHQRLAFEEFFVLELALHSQRGSRVQHGAPVLKATPKGMGRAKQALPFTLTEAQARVVAEISADLARAQPMRRLLQGDVGSGKTAVAMVAAAQAVQAGAQVAWMAPTEVLAEQHFGVLEAFGKALGLRVSLMVGGMKKSHRQRLERLIHAGEVDMVIGTHALLNESYGFKRLGLVIVDEQHRFGVNQRLALARKYSHEESSPHLLVMTATPIPRSLALTLYGDLDVSVLDAMPPGRIAPITKVFEMSARERALEIMRKGLDKGGQAFVVCPAIEDDPDEHSMRSAEATYKELQTRLAPYAVGLLHGRLPYDERQAVMAKFVKGELKVLVSTTVIEVGVDVPRANVMLVEHAERFGLAQLHQLRGRIGRAGQVSACLLVHQAQTPEAMERLEVLARTSDGFEIAEADLVQRGPGELFGQRQSGMPGFRFGNLKRDMAMLERARMRARQVLEGDPTLSQQEHQGAMHALARWQRLSVSLVREEAG